MLIHVLLCLPAGNAQVLKQLDSLIQVAKINRNSDQVKSLEAIDSVVKMFPKRRDKVMDSLYSSVLILQAVDYFYLHQFDSATVSIKNSQSIDQSPANMTMTFNLLGEIEKEKGTNLSLAENNYRIADSLAKIAYRLDTFNYYYYRSIYNINLGECQLKRHRPDKAREYFEKGKQLLDSIQTDEAFLKEKAKRIQGYYYWDMSQYYQQKKDFEGEKLALAEALKICWKQKNDNEFEWLQVQGTYRDFVINAIESDDHYNQAKNLWTDFYSNIKENEKSRDKILADSQIRAEIKAIDKVRHNQKINDDKSKFAIIVISILLILSVIALYYFQRRRLLILQENEKLLFTLKKATPAIYIFDDSDRIRFWNESFQEWGGFQPTDLEGKTFAEISSPRFPDSPGEITRQIDRGKPYTYYSSLGQKLVKTEAFQFPDDSKLNGWWVGIDTDVTQLQSIAWTVGHEMKGHLRATSDLAHSMARKYKVIMQEPGLDTDFGSVVTGIEHAYTEFMSLDSWIKSELTDDALEKKPCMLRELAEKAINNILYWANHYGIDLICEIDKTIEVLIDKQKILIVFRNLLSNSISAIIKHEAGQKKNYIRIKAVSNASHVHVFIEDSGSGIPENLKSTLFTDMEGQHGLGTRICTRYIRNHGGEIAVKESHLGFTSVEFTLPLF